MAKTSYRLRYIHGIRNINVRDIDFDYTKILMYLLTLSQHYNSHQEYFFKINTSKLRKQVFRSNL